MQASVSERESGKGGLALYVQELKAESSYVPRMLLTAVRRSGAFTVLPRTAKFTEAKIVSLRVALLGLSEPESGCCCSCATRTALQGPRRGCV